MLSRDDDYAGSGKPSCDWDDRDAREALVDALVRDALAALAVVDGAEDDEADFDVHAFGAAVADSLFDRVDDDPASVAHCACRFGERFQPGPEGPGDPPVEQRDRSRGFETGGEDRPELFFHLVRPPDPATRTFHLGELCGLSDGQVFGVLQQRPSRSLERFRVAVVGKPAELLPQVAADLVEGIADEFDEMEYVRAHERLRSMPDSGHGLQERRTEIDRHGLDLACTLGAEFVEEPVESFGVFAFATPDDTAPVVIDDKGEVLVVLAPRDLVDTDPEQAVEAVRVQFGCDDTFAGPANGAPRHPTQASDRGLVHPGRQPPEQIIEIAGQMRARSSERNLLDDHTMCRATQPPQRATHLDLPHAEIEMPPPRRPIPPVITGRRLERAVRTDSLHPCNTN